MAGNAADQGRSVAVPVLGPGDIALAAVEVEVADLADTTLAAVTPLLMLAAHGLGECR